MQLDNGVAESSRRKRSATTAFAFSRRSQRCRQMEDVYMAIGLQHVPLSPSILPPATDCNKCGATKFAYETARFCCCNGEVQIATNEFPSELINLLGQHDEAAEHFGLYARIYNNMFAFSSLGGTTDAKTEKGIYVFRLLGQFYHFIPSLLPSNIGPRYLQLYFYDAEHERENRAGLFSYLGPEIISTLMSVMEQNPYAAFFRSLREVEILEQARVIICHNPSLDQCVYNAPTCEEVAAILLDSRQQPRYHSIRQL